MEACSNCKFYKEKARRPSENAPLATEGYCRKSPPYRQGLFTETFEDSWCGEWNLLGEGSFEKASEDEQKLIRKYGYPGYPEPVDV